MNLTKTDMARVIVQALYNIPNLPPQNDPVVIRKAKRLSKGDIAELHRYAVKILQDRIKIKQDSDFRRDYGLGV